VIRLKVVKMSAKLIGATVFFGVLGTLCAVMFFANLGSGNTAGTGFGRAVGMPTSVIGLIGAVAAFGLLVYVFVVDFRTRRR
jgi:uncharacterized oligopeptide transporter (OPT) family protein